MFKKKSRVPRITTVIGVGVEIHGKVVFRDAIHLDGAVYGDVVSAEDHTESTVVVSDSGLIEGNVHVANIVLNGTVHGDVVARGRAELAPEARIEGTLYYNFLEMAMGAEVNGQLVKRNSGGQNTDVVKEQRMAEQMARSASLEGGETQDNSVSPKQ